MDYEEAKELLKDLTPEQQVIVAIKCVLTKCKEKSFIKWANDWLSGKDRYYIPIYTQLGNVVKATITGNSYSYDPDDNIKSVIRAALAYDDYCDSVKITSSSVDDIAEAVAVGSTVNIDIEICTWCMEENKLIEVDQAKIVYLYAVDTVWGFVAGDVAEKIINEVTNTN